MEELCVTAKVVLANAFVMYFKTHSYHWNVEGKNFTQYHSFFGDLYEEVYGSLDTTAEQIRALNDYAPISLSDLYKYKTIEEDTIKPEYPSQMIANLLSANNQVILSLNKLFELASSENNQGLVNYVADRLDKHAKHGWMLRSFMKSGD